MTNSEFLQAVKQSVIEGPWGKGKQFEYDKNCNLLPCCVLGHAGKVMNAFVPWGEGAKRLCNVLTTSTDWIERFNDNVRTTRWDVIAKLEQAKQYWIAQGQ